MKLGVQATVGGGLGLSTLVRCTFLGGAPRRDVGETGGEAGRGPQLGGWSIGLDPGRGDESESEVRVKGWAWA